MYTTIRVRLYPTNIQKTKFWKQVGCCRFIYNYFLDKKIKIYKKTQSNYSRFDMSHDLTQLKRKDKYYWLREAEAVSIQEVLTDLERAYTNFFRRVREGGVPGFPTFKKRRDGSGSFRLASNATIRVEGNYLRLSKLGYCRFRCSTKDLEILQEIEVRSITVRQDAGLWYAMVLFEDQSKVKHVHEHKACGIDLGIVRPLQLAYVDQNGELRYAITGLKAQERLKRKELRRKRYQRKLARKVMGSNNRKKCKKRLQRAFQAERNARKDFIEKCSTKIAKKFETVKVENLDLQKMTKKGPSSKKGLNRELLRLGISSLFTRIEQKQSKYGGQLVRVDHRNTSRQCSSCGCVDKQNRKSQAVFKCVSCGHRQNADRNAATNILFREAA